MPLYEYECNECGTIFEELVSVSTRENPACPSCSSKKTERKISLVSGFGGGSTGSCSGRQGFS